MKQWISRFILCSIFLCMLASCGSEPTTTNQNTPHATIAQTPTPNPIDGYLRVDDIGVRWLKWNEANGQLSGVWQSAVMDNGAPVYANGTLTGTRNGDQVTLTKAFDDGTTHSATGTLRDGSLWLDDPNGGDMQQVEYKGTTRADYDLALADFKARHPG